MRCNGDQHTQRNAKGLGTCAERRALPRFNRGFADRLEQTENARGGEEGICSYKAALQILNLDNLRY